MVESPEERRLREENAELKLQLQELHDTLGSIQRGEVDALVVNDDIYTLESAHAATNRLRQDVLAQMEDAVFAFDNGDNVIFVNAAAERRYGVSSADVLGRPKSDVFIEMTRAEPFSADSDFAALPPGEPRASVQATHRLASGADIHVESIGSPLVDASGLSLGSLVVIRDVSERRRAELWRDALAALNERIRDQEDPAEIGHAAAAILGETLGVRRAGYATVDPRTDTLFMTRDWHVPEVDSLAGALKLRDFGSFVDSLKANQLVCIANARRDARTADAAAALEARGVRSFVSVPVIEQGLLVALMFVNHSQVRQWTAEELSFIREVADRTRVASERARGSAALRDSQRRLHEANENLERIVEARTRELMDTEQALRQAQKMEAVGQLTGGIAHDFNNLLASISAALQVLQSRLKSGKLNEIDRYFSMGHDSVRRAAALTQRLLAFARRQTLDPKPTDVNRLVGGMEDLIRRTVGPSVKVEVVGAGGLWSTKIDPSQLENSLLNLCINARDAMLPDGGRLTIETANKWLDEHAAAGHDLPAGQYIALSVTDTGSGMSPDVIKRVFDPFFTTKPLGQGTGLGLSMVYGFVRQSGGQVRVYSEVSSGTTMSLYLPRHSGIAEDSEADEVPAAQQGIDAGDGETVLVIEDEPNIRLLIAEVLGEAGYRTITAPDGPAGLKVLESRRRVDLLITDVGLPGGMNGRQIADAARMVRPDLKVLFITGYAENAAVGDGHLDKGMAVMTKPFEIAALANRVRQMTGV